MNGGGSAYRKVCYFEYKKIFHKIKKIDHFFIDLRESIANLFSYCIERRPPKLYNPNYFNSYGDFNYPDEEFILNSHPQNIFIISKQFIQFVKETFENYNYYILPHVLLESTLIFEKEKIEQNNTILNNQFPNKLMSQYGIYTYSDSMASGHHINKYARIKRTNDILPLIQNICQIK